MTRPVSLAPLVERFFTQRLMQQRQASPHTISSYRDTFRHFLKFVQRRLQTPPARLTFEEFDAPLIVAFLDDLERHGLSIRSRNLRLTAFHSFFRYAAFELPTHAKQIQRVLAIPSKRFTRTLVQFLTRAEVDALLTAPDQRTWFGRRDHAFLPCGGTRLRRRIATYSVELRQPPALAGKQIHVHRVALYECESCGHLMPTMPTAAGRAKVERCVARGIDFFLGRIP